VPPISVGSMHARMPYCAKIAMILFSGTSCMIDRDLLSFLKRAKTIGLIIERLDCGEQQT
jgi:hypothetical protein